MVDISGELLEQIRKDYRTARATSGEQQDIIRRISAGKARERDLYRYAELEGDFLTDALKKHITADALPNGQMYENIARKVLEPLADEATGGIIEQGVALHTYLNHAEGYGIKGATPSRPDRITGIIHRLSNSDNIEDVSWLLDRPVKTLLTKVVDDCILANADNLMRSVGSIRVTRLTDGHCCEWCTKMSGSHEYGEEPKDFWRRHHDCTCRIEYNRGGNITSAWSKVQYTNENREEMIQADRERMQKLDEADRLWREQNRRIKSGEKVERKSYAQIRRDLGIARKKDEPGAHKRRRR